MRLENKIVIITGGGSGIGRAVCDLFAAEGADLMIADKNADAAEAAAGAARAAGRRVEAMAVDVADSAGIRRMIDDTVAAFGRIDVLVNNAGYGITGSVVETDEADWDALIAVNLRGVYLGCKYVIPVMREPGGGVIVNTASVVAAVGIRDRAAYVASKGAVAALTRAMALDHVDDGIRVNAVAPGTIETAYFDRMFANSDDPDGLRRRLEARHPMNRLGTPMEVAYAMLYLASDESGFSTDSILTVDGGMSAR